MSDLHTSAITDLSGRVALITGGGTGIGNMAARGLAANGAKVYITGRRLAVLEKAATVQVPGAKYPLTPIELDVTDQVSINRAVKLIEEKEGKLDILINNAAVGGFQGSLEEMTIAAQKGQLPQDSFANWNLVFTTNVFAIHFVTASFTPLLVKGAQATETASVINISSMVGVTHLSMDMPAYVVSKGALEHLTRVQATEFGLKGQPIRVNSIAFGPFSTPASGSDAFMHSMVTRVSPGQVGAFPIQRAGKEAEVVGTILYLASAAGNYTNGTSVRVDGGFSTINP